MKRIPFLSQSKSLDYSQWPFPSCANLNTFSFRTTNYSKDNNVTSFTTFNDMITTVSSSSSSTSFLAMSDDPIESIIRGLRSERLFFEPESSCSLLVSNKQADPGEEDGVVYKESEALCMDSSNPCEDFRSSMEDMVEAHELKDWQGLEELLGCYLKINDKVNHGYIMAAFIDLLVNISITSSSSTRSSTTTTCLSSTNLNSSPSSPLSLPSSSLTTPCLSSLLDHDEDDDEVSANYLL